MRRETDEFHLPARPADGRPPRKHSGLLLVVGALTVVLLALFVVLRLVGQGEDRTAQHKSPSAGRETGGGSQEAGTPQGSLSLGTPTGSDNPVRSTSNPAVSPGETASDDGSAPSATQRPPESARHILPPLPEIFLPQALTPGELDSVALPPLPYSIFTGAYKSLAEAETTRRELLSHFIPSYIVPVEVQGSVAQSLYGVTSDGSWYRILIGHFSTQDQARQFLGTLMELRPNERPEIVKFTYAVECARFLHESGPDPLLNRIHEDGFLPYRQTFPAHDGTQLTRVLVGCNFSTQGAQKLRDALAERGYSCKIAER